jgi:hypothetical protein
VAARALYLAHPAGARGLQRQQRLEATGAHTDDAAAAGRPALLGVDRAQFAVARGPRAAAGIVPLGPVPVIGMLTLVSPLSTLTLPIASVPSWQDRQSLELPPGVALKPAAIDCASSVSEVYGV